MWGGFTGFTMARSARHWTPPGSHKRQGPRAARTRGAAPGANSLSRPPVAAPMKVALPLVLLSFALLAGCSGPGGPVTPQQDAKGHYIIHMPSGNVFSPRDATVPVGANVTWVHDGGAAHNVVDLGTPSAFASPVILSGQAYTHRFGAPGTFHYHCEYHTGMEGTLTVA